MQNASRHPFGLICKEPCDRERVPKGGQAPESFYWKDLSRYVKAPGPEDTNASAGAISNPTSPSVTDSGRDATHQSSKLDPTERQEASP
jgi:hypothetical protein